MTSSISNGRSPRAFARAAAGGVTTIVVQPDTDPAIDDPALIGAASEIGVMLLLFTIGIEFSLDKLARIFRLIFVGGGLQVLLTVAAVTGVLLAFGVSLPNAVFTGFLLSLSSTAIVTTAFER